MLNTLLCLYGRIAKINSWLRRSYLFGLLLALFLNAGIASAATVGLAINVSSAKSNYTATEVETYTVELTNRGPANASNAYFSLDVPSTIYSTISWNANVTCVATGSAVCPTAYNLVVGATTLSGTVPLVPVNSKITLTIPAPGAAAASFEGAMNVVANVAAQLGDSNSDSSTSRSNIIVYIIPGQYQFGTTIPSGPAAITAPGGSQQRYTVVLQNTGADINDIVTGLTLVASQGSGSTTSLGYVPGTKFNSITCASASGGASCANVVATQNVSYQRSILNPQPVPLVNQTAGNTNLNQSIGATQMPGGSSITLNVVVDVGIVACSTNGASDTRNLNLTSAMAAIYPSGRRETSPTTPADNSATWTTTIAAPQCGIGDLMVNGITQPSAQTAIGPNAPFSYTVTYSNGSGATANNAPLTFVFIWPAVPSSATVFAPPTCVASAGAICPGSYSSSGLLVTGVTPSLPAGGSLQITYTGTSGSDTTTQCQPLYSATQAQISPPSDFFDNNYNPNSSPQYQTNTSTQGNNAYQVITQANIGVSCAPSFDAVSSKSGPYLDFATTTLAPQPLKPGQYVYFKTSAANVAPGLPFNSYLIRDDVGITLGSLPVITNGSRGNRTLVTANPSDPPGLMTPPGFTVLHTPPMTVDQYDSGVHCMASGGAVCPDYAAPGGNGGGGAGFWESPSWVANWASATQPPLPVGGRLDFVSTYRVPPLRVSRAAGGCATTASAASGNNMFLIGLVLVDPMGSDRQPSNDTTAVPMSVSVPACNQTLTVLKTIQSPTVPPSGLINYTLVLTNTSGANLDLPRLIDFTGYRLVTPTMTMTCQSTTLGAQCPNFAPQQNVKVLADGTSRPIDSRDFPSSNTLLAFDFVWGSAGAATLPPGSSITFAVAAQYPSGEVPQKNYVYFTGSESSTTGLWPTVSSSAGPTIPVAGTLGISMAVVPLQASPGQSTSYTVDALNYAGSQTNIYFEDLLSSQMAAANPAGFANVVCRPIVAADNVFPSATTVGAATCPVFNNSASSTTAVIPSFPANSGLRLTYTVTAPANPISVPNTSSLRHDPAALTVGDANSQVNYTVFATAMLSGNVFNDINGSSIKDNGETSSPLPAGLNAVITDSTGTVIAVAAVDANGNYTTSVPANATYTVTMTTASPGVGTVPAGGVPVVLPAGWATTGENLSGVPDNTPNSMQTVAVGTADLANVNFGMEQPPVAGNAQYPNQANPGGGASVPIDAGAFLGPLPTGVTGSTAFDPAPGAVVNVIITKLPSNVSSITINGVSYTSANFPVAGVKVTPAQLAAMAVQPVTGAVTVVVPYVVTDAAAKVSGPGSVSLPLVVGPDVLTTTTVANNNGSATFTVVTSNLTGVDPAVNTVTTLQLPTGLNGVVVNGGGTYNPATGLVTWPAITLAPGASNPAAQTAVIPYVIGTTVVGSANVSADNEPASKLANNPSSAQLSTLGPVTVPVVNGWLPLLGLSLMMLVAIRRRGGKAVVTRR